MRVGLIALLVVGVCLGTTRGRAADDDPLKPFPLLERGIIVGAGLGIHAVGLGARPRQGSAATTGFAYIGVIPAYWFLGNVTRKFCASVGDKQDAANLFAAQLAYPNTDPELLARKLKTPEFSKPDEQVELFTVEQRTYITKQSGWDLGSPGSCFRTVTWLGLFAALPASYNANVRTDDATAPTISKEIRPFGSFGVLLAPKPYAHVLLGFTYASVGLGSPDVDVDEQVWSLFVGLGTTIDIVGAAFK